MKGKVVETVEDGIDLIGQVCMFVGEGCVVDGQAGYGFLKAVGSGFAGAVVGHGKSDQLLEQR